MKRIYYILILSSLVAGCVTQFIPDTGYAPGMYVIEGMITDQPGRNYIKVSMSVPLGKEVKNIPVSKCGVWITDNHFNRYNLTESTGGIYVLDPTFAGVPGREYTLNVEVVHILKEKRIVDYTLQSSPVKMIPVPEIKNLFYEKVTLPGQNPYIPVEDGAQVLLDSGDPENKCKFYKWEYTETWKVQGPPFQLSINTTCYITAKSKEITIQSVKGLNENRIDRLPVKFINTVSDRLRVRYRIAVDQYSINEDEYNYWSKLKKIADASGGLYDFIPASLQGNMFCTSSPELPVLGYFSVSALRSKYIYIDEFFRGQYYPYGNCIKDTIYKDLLDTSPFPVEAALEGGAWMVEDRWDSSWLHAGFTENFVIFTKDRYCVDCTLLGTTLRPDYWEDK